MIRQVGRVLGAPLVGAAATYACKLATGGHDVDPFAFLIGVAAMTQTALLGFSGRLTKIETSVAKLAARFYGGRRHGEHEPGSEHEPGPRADRYQVPQLRHGERRRR